MAPCLRCKISRGLLASNPMERREGPCFPLEIAALSVNRLRAIPLCSDNAPPSGVVRQIQGSPIPNGPRSPATCRKWDAVRKLLHECRGDELSRRRSGGRMGRSAKTLTQGGKPCNLGVQARLPSALGYWLQFQTEVFGQSVNSIRLLHHTPGFNFLEGSGQVILMLLKEPHVRAKRLAVQPVLLGQTPLPGPDGQGPPLGTWTAAGESRRNPRIAFAPPLPWS